MYWSTGWKQASWVYLTGTLDAQLDLEPLDLPAGPHSVTYAEISGDGSVKGERQGADVLSAEGDTFGMSMKMYGLPYRITNTVVEYEDGRRIAWCHPGKHRWRWEVEPVATGGCTVTETFDMSTSIALVTCAEVSRERRTWSAMPLRIADIGSSVSPG